jgi:hypothetical protein
MVHVPALFAVPLDIILFAATLEPDGDQHHIRHPLANATDPTSHAPPPE